MKRVRLTDLLSGTMVPRLCKIALVASVGLFLLLVVFNNLTDYGSNYAFVSHVLAMDTTFEGNRGMWRAIRQPAAYHTAYAVIIGWEAVAMGLCFAGATKLWAARKANVAVFNRAKTLAMLGLTVSLLLWFAGFITIGGEWFLMWQSRVWNGQEAAFRLFTCTGIVLLILIQKDED